MKKPINKIKRHIQPRCGVKNMAFGVRHALPSDLSFSSFTLRLPQHPALLP